MDSLILRESRLLIDLGAVESNYRRVQAEVGRAAVAAMVKSNGYGLGAELVAARLAARGCSTFFVASVGEAVALRESLGDGPTICVLNGALPGTVDDLTGHRLVPVLNGFDQIDRWAEASRGVEERLPAIVHLDTGMHRLGLTRSEWQRFIDERWVERFDVRLVMSHLASADSADVTSAENQRSLFLQLAGRLPGVPLSLANSGGVFCGPAFHLDLVRPGIALYGGSPRPGIEMAPVVTIEAPVVQVFDVSPGDEIGYGGTHRMDRPGRLATVAVGYGDGFHRAASSRGAMWIGDYEVPIVGRVSMDLTTVDVSALPRDQVWPGRAVEVLGRHRTIDAAASVAGTISYEMLTDLGRRYHRIYC